MTNSRILSGVIFFSVALVAACHGTPARPLLDLDRDRATLQSAGWGPPRSTYTVSHPASTVTFNSIIDNPQHGDERNLVSIKPADASNRLYGSEITVAPDNEYEVYVLFHNNAAANLNDEVHDHRGGCRKCHHAD